MKKRVVLIILIAILIIYTVLSFHNLGSTKNPQTMKKFDVNEMSYLHFNTNVGIDKVRVYVGNDISDIDIYLMEKKDSEYAYYLDHNFDYTSVFTWQEFEITGTGNYSYIGIASYDYNNVIGEIVALDKYGNVIDLIADDSKDKELVDESNMNPDKISYMNSTYFDEIYHARTAYEQLNNVNPFESVHPPLGKIIISIPVALFGMTPFAFRLMGNIAGILMILIMYFIGKEIFKSEWFGLVSASIMALDGMHFVQTRIATVDSFLVLFCMISFLFMIKKKKLLYLLLSGLFIGMGIATKWTALFVGLGLAIIFFVHLIYNSIKDKKISKDNIITVCFCVLFFIIIPAIIYWLAYIPLYKIDDCTVKDLKSLVEYTKGMYEYHSKLNAEHPFTSEWYTWPILKVPMWYYVNYLPNNMISTISCMGNPFIWWLGIGTTVISLLYMIIKRNKEAALFIVMIVTTWLPYLFIGRVMFIYHYFITLPFVMLSIVFVLKKIEEKLHIKYISIIVLFVFLFGFVYFFPVYSGKEVSMDYIEQTKWFDTWIY